MIKTTSVLIPIRHLLHCFESWPIECLNIFIWINYRGEIPPAWDSGRTGGHFKEHHALKARQDNLQDSVISLESELFVGH
jgi:hypothetical protein